jgi:tRNA (guanine37-N1)-methyltransferase
MFRKIPFDIIGNVALVKFSKEDSKKTKKDFANKLLRSNSSIKTILEKIGKFKGRLRKQETRYVLGDKTNEVLYRENGCVFRFNIDSTYFSPRLSNERKEIADLVKKNNDVLVMFAGVSPFSIVIAKHSQARKVVSVEINREANKYAMLNVELNKVKDRVEIVQGDVKKFVKKVQSYSPIPTRPPKRNFNTKKIRELTINYKKRMELKNIPSKFDVIVMARPQLKESFLKEAFSLSKKGTRIFYYDFCGVEEKKEIIEKIKGEAKKFGKKIKILKTKIAGEIAPYRIRLRVDFRVL